MANNSYVEGAKRGLADLAGLPVDTLLNLVDLSIAAGGFAGKETGLIKGLPEILNRENIVGSGENIAKLFGIGKPSSPEDSAYNMARFGTSAGAGAGGASRLILPMIKASIGGNIAGLTYTEAVKRFPDNPALQVLGAMFPQVASTLGSTTIKSIATPAYISRHKPDTKATERIGEDYQKNLQILKEQGLTSATRGMASGDPAVLATEQYLYTSPSTKNIPQASVLRLAEQSKASVAKIIDKISGLSDPTKAGKAFSNAYNANVEQLIKKRSEQANKDFAGVQDKVSPVISTNNFKGTIGNLINEFATGEGVSGAISKDLNSKIVAELEALHNATPDNISVKAIKARLEQYSGASVGKDKLFADLNWKTQERRVASILTDALNKDLDTHIISNPSGDATQLKIARANYADNSKAINAFADSAIGRFFNVDKEISGTNAYKKFMGLHPEDKISVMQVLPKEVQDSLQKTAQVELMKKAESPFSVQKGKPTWDTETWLKGLENLQKTRDFDILFSPAQKRAMTNNIDALRMTLREGSVVNEATPTGTTMMDIARAGAGSRGYFSAKSVGDVLNTMSGLNAETRASIMFSPLGESQFIKGIMPKNIEGKLGSAIGKIQSTNQVDSPKLLDEMNEEEIKALFLKEFSGLQPSKEESIDNLSDEEVKQLYAKEFANQSKPAYSTEAEMRQAIGNPESPEEDLKQQRYWEGFGVPK